MSSFNNYGIPVTIQDLNGNPYNSSNPPLLDDAKAEELAGRLKGNDSDTLLPKYKTLVSEGFKYYTTQYEPFITNDIYNQTTTSFDGIPIGKNADQINERFFKALALLLEKKSRRKQEILNSGNAEIFAAFLEKDEATREIRYRQVNVLLYCIDKLLEAMRIARETEYIYSKDLIKYFYGMLQAQTTLSSIKVPEVQPSNINAQLADPESFSAQQTALVEKEKYRQAFNLSRDRSRQTETNLQFAKEIGTQFSLNIESMFDRQKITLQSIIKS